MTTQAEKLRQIRECSAKSGRWPGSISRPVSVKTVSRFGHTLTNSPDHKRIVPSYHKRKGKVSLAKLNLPEASNDQ